MKVLIVLLAVATVFYSAPTVAKPCSSLAYEELKDMKADELKHEICTARANADDAYQQAFRENMSKHTDDAAVQALEAEGAQCKNEVTRILRVLTKTDPASASDATMCQTKR